MAFEIYWPLENYFFNLTDFQTRYKKVPKSDFQSPFQCQKPSEPLWKKIFKKISLDFW